MTLISNHVKYFSRALVCIFILCPLCFYVLFILNYGFVHTCCLPAFLLGFLKVSFLFSVVMTVLTISLSHCGEHFPCQLFGNERVAGLHQS